MSSNQFADIYERLKAYFEGPIDFAGQKKAERLAQVILFVSAAISFLVGIIAQDLRYTLAIYALGLVAALTTCVPPWNFYRAHSGIWLTPKQTKKIQ